MSDDTTESTYRMLIGILIFAIVVLGAVGLVTGIQHHNLDKMRREQDHQQQPFVEVGAEYDGVEITVPCTLDEVMTAVYNDAEIPCGMWLTDGKMMEILDRAAMPVRNGG